jgi:hypothetical protein
MTTPQCPYYKALAYLPGQLPSIEEIEAATETLPTNHYGSRIVIIRDLFVVKYGAYVLENEGFALLFLENQLTIPAPTLYAMFRQDSKLYLVMEYLPGVKLSELWPSLSVPDKLSISQQLRGFMDKMRSIQAPKHQFSSITGGPIPHRYFWSRENDPSVTGPFTSEKDFNLAMAQRSRLIWQEKNRCGWVSDFFTRNLPYALRDHEPTFTHADFHAGNILVISRASQDGIGKGDLKVSGIVDWETSGWYPSYWEYAASFVNFTWLDDWPETFEHIVAPWPLEAAMLRMVRQDLEF